METLGSSVDDLSKHNDEATFTDEQREQLLDERLAAYVEMGWDVVDRRANPPRARLAYVQRRRSGNPAPLVARDSGERVLWIDEAGEVRIERTGPED